MSATYATLPLPMAPLPAAERAAEAQATLDDRTAPDALEARACAALSCSGEERRSAYAACPLPLSAEHAHYVDGVGLYLQAAGAAVAVCPSGPLHVEVDGDTDGAEAAALRAVMEEAGVAWRVAGAVARPAGEMAAVAGLAAALASLLPDAPPPDRIAAVLSEVVDRPVSRALVAAAALAPAASPYVLADARTGRARAFPVPDEMLPGAEIAWALVDVSTSASPDGDQLRSRVVTAEDVARRLRANGMGEGMASLRDLEHRSLDEALAALPKAEQPLTRYLVGEDRRAQRMLAALRRGRVAMLGGTLLVGHAALGADAGERTDGADWVVERSRGVDGLFGARAFCGARFVLVLGRPHALPPFLDLLQDGFVDLFGRLLRVRIL